MCIYCKNNESEGEIDDEYHLFLCPIFSNQSRCLFGKIGSVIGGFNELSFNDKVKTLLCPINSQICRLVNKYIKIVFTGRDRLDGGEHPDTLTFPPRIELEEFEDEIDSLESELEYESSGSD